MPRPPGVWCTVRVKKMETCAVCGEEIRINPFTYAPPNADQPITDEGMWCEKLGGYVCEGCFELAPWNEEERIALLLDWGFEKEVA